MTKRLTEKQKKEIIEYFCNGATIEIISKKFNFSKLTISRNLKKNLGEKKYKEIIINSKSLIQSSVKKEENIPTRNQDDSNITNFNEKYSYENKFKNDSEEEMFPIETFMEITPLDYEIENVPRKDLSSIPISEIEFPKIVYMIVDKKIELEIKYLREYPDWHFLSQDELNRKTIEIHEDLKNAKRFCNKEQKVIKVPNTKVFKIVAPLLISKGISRIVSEGKLIAL